MRRTVVRAASHFDGLRHHPKCAGPRDIVVEGGRIVAVDPASDTVVPDVEAAFVMPGLVEAHARIFLDGEELDLGRRDAYMGADFDTMLDTARANVARSKAAGITLVRDAGDHFGVDDAIRSELAADPTAGLCLRSPGFAAKQRPGRGEAASAPTPEGGAATVAGDDVGVVVTGRIDFEAGRVAGAPRFGLDELTQIVEAAHRAGRRVFARCCGVEGIEVAIAANVDAVELGYFMTSDLLVRMAIKGIAWVPTFSPMHFRCTHPDVADRSPAAAATLRRLLDHHLEQVALADRIGLDLVAGSNAGSLGVPHGRGLVDEIFRFLEAGLPMEAALETATERPRRLWNLEAATVARGSTADLVALPTSPFDDPAALRGPFTRPVA